MNLKKAFSALAICAISGLPVTSHAQAVDTVSPAIRFIDEWGRTTRRMMDGATGYIPAGSSLALGPVASFIGYNTLDGFRLGLGVKTTAGLSRHISIGGYGAYAFGDHRWKYGAEAEWSFRQVDSYYGSYPINALKGVFSYDTEALGASSLSCATSASRFRFSLRRNEMMLYRREGRLEYNLEPSVITAIRISGSRERYYPTRFIGFGPLHTLDAWRLSGQFLWHIGGDMFQTPTRRINLKPYAPTLALRGQWVKGASDADHTDMLIVEACAEKSTPLGSSASTFSVLAHAAVTVGHGAFPFMPSLPSSPYILRRFGSFALLRPLELPSDRYIDLHMRFDDGGYLLGLIPAIKPLGISATASFDAAVGSLSDSNNPSLDSSLPPFPYYPEKSLTWSRPYAEAGIGLDNILGIGRIEYVWRLNYRSNVGARRGGIAIGIDMLF